MAKNQKVNSQEEKVNREEDLNINEAENELESENQSQDIEELDSNEESKLENEAEKENQSDKASESKDSNQIDEMELLNNKVDELNDKYLRLFSEFDNFRKRTIKEKSDIYKTAGFEIIKDLLPIVDDFERALGSVDEKDELKPHKEGMLLIYNKLVNMLKQKGLTEIQAIGEDFDTDLHEAVTKIKAPKKKLRGKVVDVLEKGYKLNDKVVRYSKVVIGE